MISFHNPLHYLHAPAHEFFRGNRVDCFEKPARADYVEQALRQAGYELLAPDTDATGALKKVHSQRYLDFLASAWAEWVALAPANALLPAAMPVKPLCVSVAGPLPGYKR